MGLNLKFRKFLAGREAILCFVAVLCLCLVCDFFIARSNTPDSDGMRIYNELSSARAGHFLLPHWILSNDNFYFTDLPFYVVGGFIFGHGLNLTYIVPFCVFALLLAGCLLLAARAAQSNSERIFGIFAILFLLGLPFGLVHEYLLQSAYHAGTIALCLYAVLCAQPALSGQRANWLLLVPFTLCIFCVAASDPLADIFCIVPLFFLVVLRAWLYSKFRLAEWVLFGCAFAATALGAGFADVVGHHGGFTTSSAFTLDFVPSAGSALRNFHAVAGAIQILFSARSIVLPGVFGHSIVAAIRFITVCIVIGLCLFIIWRAPRAPQSGAAQWLVLGATCLAAIDVMSDSFTMGISDGPGFPNGAVRYVTPIYVFMSVAAVIEAQALFGALSRRLRWAVILPAIAAAGIFLVFAGAVAAQMVFIPPGYRQAPQYQLTTWLARHHFTYGVSDYWTSQMILALSRNAVITDPVAVQQNRLVAYGWLCDVSRLDQGWPPQFVVIQPGNLFGVTLDAVKAKFGQPLHVFQIGGYIVAQLAKITN